MVILRFRSKIFEVFQKKPLGKPDRWIEVSEGCTPMVFDDPGVHPDVP